LSNRLLRDQHDFIARQIATGGESPRAVYKYTNSKSERLVVSHTLHAALAREQRLIPVAADSYVGVARSGRARCIERAHGEFLV
jgi:hypothetical protein